VLLRDTPPHEAFYTQYAIHVPVTDRFHGRQTLRKTARCFSREEVFHLATSQRWSFLRQRLLSAWPRRPQRFSGCTRWENLLLTSAWPRKTWGTLLKKLDPQGMSGGTAMSGESNPETRDLCAILYHPPDPERAKTRSCPRQAQFQRARSASKRTTWPPSSLTVGERLILFRIRARLPVQAVILSAIPRPRIEYIHHRLKFACQFRHRSQQHAF
jgi:hypothetical protein